MLNQGVPQVFMLTHYSTAFGCGVRQRKVLKYVLQDFSLFCFIKKRCVRDFNLHNQEISQSCNMLIIIKLLQINYITKYH